ncbi:VapE domain-containing protein [Terrisporobacter sp.]
MKIAVVNNRKEKQYNNMQMSWEEFCNKVKNTTRTKETMAEYASFPKEKQDNIKDVGGFVGGSLREGRRKKGYVECRSLITLDMDYGRENILEELSMLFDFSCCIYSTHKHKPKSPRYRLIIPLSREVSEEEYEPLSRMVASKIDMELFDDSTYEANRLMYWPSTSIDGEFIYKEIEGKTLDVDFYLSQYEDYQDINLWPYSSRENKPLNRRGNSQRDPLLKENIVGAFCRAYSISEAIDKFLSDVYSPSTMEDRYDYIPAKSSAGVVIYNNKFAYSHHSTDPASNQLLNAFDLVRLHKFNKSPDTSYNDMCQFAVTDDKVKLQLYKDRRSSAKEDFADLNWQAKLDIDKKGNIKHTLENLVLIIDNDENLKSIAFNTQRDNIDVRGHLPWDRVKEGWSDSDTASLKVYLSKNYHIYAPAKTKDALISVAATRLYHPIKEYLENLPPWDEIPRVENLLIDYFGAENNAYTKTVTRKTLIAAVSRIYNPGIKFDSVLIINGPQDIGKSTFFEKLAGSWFSDSLTITDMKDKSAAEKLQGYWILEIGELAGMKKMDVETIKSFISRTDDKYRASYGVSVEDHPRQCIIVGSTNAESGFLRDITGNRRFWPVKVSGDSKYKSWDMTREEVEQIWAETLELYKRGEKLYLEGEVKQMAIKEQFHAMESDDREGLIRNYLDKLLPKNWSNMDLYERRSFLRGDDFSINNQGTVQRKIVCNMEIWSECFGNDPSTIKSADSYAISAIMKKIENWQRFSGNKGGMVSFEIYGRQRCYERVEEEQA